MGRIVDHVTEKSNTTQNLIDYKFGLNLNWWSNLILTKTEQIVDILHSSAPTPAKLLLIVGWPLQSSFNFFEDEFGGKNNISCKAYVGLLK